MPNILCKMHNLTCIKPNILNTRDTRTTNLYKLFFFQWSTNLPNKLLPRVIKVCITIRTQETEFALKSAKCNRMEFYVPEKWNLTPWLSRCCRQKPWQFWKNRRRLRRTPFPRMCWSSDSCRTSFWLRNQS